ncbi:MAG: DUF5309 family protein [Muribaculaceae bacterium]|nr:DUF5309 family protein [Muribaculaceae bacterium]
MSIFSALRRVRNTVAWFHRNYRVILTVIIFILVAILSFGMDGGSMASLALAAPGIVVAGTDDGKHIVDGTLTTNLARQASPELLLNEIDREIIKIRPMATPLDQLSRYATVKRAGSMIVDYYTVDTKPTQALLSQDYAEGTDVTPGTDAATIKISTTNDDIFSATDTILVKGVRGYDGDGRTQSADDLVLYVVSRDSTSGLQVMPINGKTVNGIKGCLPDIEEGTALIRMGRAATELDVMSPQFEALPHKSRNFCQIFKMQVEQSVLQKLASKEVGWTLTDQEEAAIFDMRLGIEKSFLFGVQQQLWHPEKKETLMLTGGIWRQAGKQFAYTTGTFSHEKLIELMREAFTGNNGSKRKVLIGGSKLISSLSTMDYDRVVFARETVSKWGIDFTELRSRFGTLYLMLSEVFDECDMATDGIIIDPDYICKYVHIPFSAEQLNLKSSGLRNVDALVLTEASCLVLRYPNVHMRIVKQ